MATWCVRNEIPTRFSEVVTGRLNARRPHRHKIDYSGVGGRPEISCNLLKRMVGERGFEPPTPWSRTRCSTRLSHSPMKKAARLAASYICDYTIGQPKTCSPLIFTDSR